MHVSPSWLGCSTIQCTTSRYKVSIAGHGGGGVTFREQCLRDEHGNAVPAAHCLKGDCPREGVGAVDAWGVVTTHGPQKSGVTCHVAAAASAFT